MFPYDSDLIALSQTVPKSIPDVLASLRAIDATCIDQDGLKWFNWLYLQVTQAVETRVSSGGFTDPAWLAELDVQFAALYFRALNAFLSRQPAPGCWDVLFQNRNQTHLGRIQFALAGINAHINRDLPPAILATCAATNTTIDRGIHYTDFVALNTTLDSLIDEAKTELRFDLCGNSLPPVGIIEDKIASWSVAVARENAWDNAERLNELRREALLEDSFMDGLDGVALVFGKVLLVPLPL